MGDIDEVLQRIAEGDIKELLTEFRVDLADRRASLPLTLQLLRRAHGTVTRNPEPGRALSVSVDGENGVMPLRRQPP